MAEIAFKTLQPKIFDALKLRAARRHALGKINDLIADGITLDESESEAWEHSLLTLAQAISDDVAAAFEAGMDADEVTHIDAFMNYTRKGIATTPGANELCSANLSEDILIKLIRASAELPEEVRLPALSAALLKLPPLADFSQRWLAVSIARMQSEASLRALASTIANQLSSGSITRGAYRYFSDILEQGGASDHQGMRFIRMIALFAKDVGSARMALIQFLANRSSQPEYAPIFEEIRDIVVAELMRAEDEMANADASDPDEIERLDFELAMLYDLFSFSKDYDGEISELLAQGAKPNSSTYVLACIVRAKLRSGREVTRELVERACATPEYRHWVFDACAAHGVSDYFPQRYATQAQRAFDSMWRWLKHPREYNAPPEKLELLATYLVSAASGNHTPFPPEDGEGEDSSRVEGRLLVFRYLYADNVESQREKFPDCPSEKLGWEIGVSGLYPDDDQALSLLESNSDVTFSHFNAQCEMNIEEHIRSFNLTPLEERALLQQELAE